MLGDADINDATSVRRLVGDVLLTDARSTENVPPNPSLPDAGGTLIQAGDLAGLAARADIDATGLAASIAAFNRSIRSGASGPY